MTTRRFSLAAPVREQLQRAAAASTGRTATTVYSGREQALRHTLVALTAGTSLTEHDNPGEATPIVSRGRVRLHADHDNWEGHTGTCW